MEPRGFEFTPRELEIIEAADRTQPNKSYGVSFCHGAKWADAHPQSPWVSVKDALPPLHEKVLVYGNFNRADSTAIVDSPSVELNQRFFNVEQKRMRRLARRVFDKYGFPNHGNAKYEVLYWMPIPAIPKGDNNDE